MRGLFTLVLLASGCVRDHGEIPDRVYYDANLDPAISSLGAVYSHWEQADIVNGEPIFGNRLTVNDYRTGEELTTYPELGSKAGVIGPDGFYLSTSGSELVVLNREHQEHGRITLAGNADRSVPTTDYEGNFFVGTEVGFLQGFDIDGQQLWATQVGAPLTGRMTLDRDARVYSLIDDGEFAAGFGCFDARTGEELWRVEERHIWSPVSIGNDGSVLVVTYGGDPAVEERDHSAYRVRSYSPEGVEQWVWDPEGFALMPVVAPDGDLIVAIATDGDEQARLVRLTPEGSVVWTADGYTFMGNPTIATGGRILVGCNSQLCQLSLDSGALQATYGTEGFPVAWSPAISQGWIVANASGVNVGWEVSGIGLEGRGFPRRGGDNHLSGQAP